MSRKKKKSGHNVFYVGKGIYSDKYPSPIKGAPNTDIRFYLKVNGKLHQIRKIGNDGTVVVDYDLSSILHDKDHKHKFVNKKRSKAPDYSLTKKEKVFIKKAKRKRKVWNNEN